MRIVSDFRDYYDAVQATGQDRSLVYIRKKKEEDSFRLAATFGNYRSWQSECITVSQYIVGYCGQVYPALKLTADNGAEKFCYNLKGVDDFVQANFREKQIEDYRQKGRGKGYWPWWLRRHDFERVFQKWEDAKGKYGDYFRDNHAPVFVVKGKRVTYNGCLKEVEFFRVKDPYTAFQDISMYLGGLAAPEKPIPQVSDEVMAEIKGFDKWSFRKEPRKK